MKQAIVIRKDLNMSPGKLATQAAHGSVAVFKKVDSEVKQQWEAEGERKIILQINNADELLELQEEANKLGIPNEIISDDGFTELDPNTKTVITIGPGDDDIIDKVTGNLDLY